MALVKYNNNSISDVTALAGVPAGALTLISTTTASSDSTISITSGIDSTYPIYKFVFINIHPATDGATFQVNFRDGGSNYDATKTTTYFYSRHTEGGSDGALAYGTSDDLAQSTAFQNISHGTNGIGSDNDQCGSGELLLFNPSSTTFVKHFLSTFQEYNLNNYSLESFVGGYCNVTAAIDGVQFKFDSGNIDAGTIKLYGIKDS